ncbi:MAG: hypothetical protein OMM_14487, partial [Candidatus Magnetoglobus multicellularis str. Araruama]
MVILIFISGENIYNDITSKIYQNIGGNFIEDMNIDLPGVENSSIAFGDYDNDGDIDLLITGSSSSGKIAKVYQNTGGSFSEDTDINLPGIEYGSVVFGDYDNDGDLDILISGVSDYGNIAKIYQNTDSNFHEDTSTDIVGVNYGSVDVGDYYNNGNLDILITGYSDNGSTARVYQNTGGNFTEDSDINLPGTYRSSVTSGDYDSDGDLDILFSGYYRMGKVYRNTDGNFSENTDVNLPGVYYSSVAFGDYDNDGDLDILISGTSDSGRIAKVYRNTDGRFNEDTGIKLPGINYSSV